MTMSFPPGKHAGEPVVDTSGSEHRKDQQLARVVGGGCFGQQTLKHGEHDHFVGVDDPFRVACRPAGVKDHRGRVGRYLDRYRRMVASALGEDRVHRYDDHSGPVSGNRAQLFHLPVIGDHEPRQCVADEIFEFRDRVFRVCRRDDRAQFHQSHSRDAPFHRIVAGNHHHVTRPDALRLHEPSRDAIAPAIEFQIADLVIFDDDGGMVWPGTDPPPKRISE
ncbi:MAG: hypothetical protein R3E09_13465 [Novosphingobium sp.]